MSDLTSMLAPLGGGIMAGYICGYAIKKILKLAVKIAAIVVGVFFMGLLFMQSKGYVGAINWDRISNDLYNTANSTVGNVDTSNVMGWFDQFGIPASSGFVAGFGISVVRS